jgi:DNA repair protein RadC
MPPIISKRQYLKAKFRKASRTYNVLKEMKKMDLHYIKISDLEFMKYIGENKITKLNVIYHIAKNFARPPTKKDTITTGYILHNLSSFIIFLDTEHKLLLFYNVGKQVNEDDFFTNDKQLKEFIKEQMIGNMIKQL